MIFLAPIWIPTVVIAALCYYLHYSATICRRVFLGTINFLDQ